MLRNILVITTNPNVIDSVCFYTLFLYLFLSEMSEIQITMMIVLFSLRMFLFQFIITNVHLKISQ